jgi:hypothetical protein
MALKIIPGMEDAIFDENTKFRINSRAKGALDMVVASLKETGKVRFRTKKISQEAFVNASWLWMRSIPVEDLESAIQPFVRQLEGMGEQQPDDKPVSAKTHLPLGEPNLKPKKKKA